MQGSWLEEMEKWISDVVKRQLGKSLWSNVKNEIGRSGTLESLQTYILEKMEKWEHWNWELSYLERAVQHLHFLEISCNITPSTEEPILNVSAEEMPLK